MVRTKKRRHERLETWSDDELLGLRFAELPVSTDGHLTPRFARLHRDLERRRLRFRPHAWLSSDFFSPDGVPGFALPFYLAHPRLVRLERAQVLYAEGARERECMRLLRHEAGHAIDTAFELHKRSDWRAAFGRRSQAYHRAFAVDPASTDHVRYLPHWYAQSHPAEDFAETFAVWLDPGSRWRSRATGGARAKLELVAAMMEEIRTGKPRVTLRERTESLSKLRSTLADHYARKRRRLLSEPEAPYEGRLLATFDTSDGPARSSRSAAAFLYARRASIAARVTGSFRGDSYSIDQVLSGMILRCRQLELRLKPKGRAPTLAHLAGMVRFTLRELQRGRHRLCR